MTKNNINYGVQNIVKGDNVGGTVGENRSVVTVESTGVSFNSPSEALKIIKSAAKKINDEETVELIEDVITKIDKPKAFRERFIAGVEGILRRLPEDLVVKAAVEYIYTYFRISC